MRRGRILRGVRTGFGIRHRFAKILGIGDLFLAVAISVAGIADMKHDIFKITEFKNRGGSVSNRVSGMPNGRQIRQNYVTLAEAVTRKNMLTVEALNLQVAGPALKRTSLTEEQIVDAEAATTVLADRGR